MQQFQTIYSYGNDKRQRYLSNMLTEYGFTVVDIPGTAGSYTSSQDSMPLEQCEDVYSRTGNEILLLPVAVTKETLTGIIPFIHSKHTL